MSCHKLQWRPLRQWMHETGSVDTATKVRCHKKMTPSKCMTICYRLQWRLLGQWWVCGHPSEGEVCDKVTWSQCVMPYYRLQWRLLGQWVAPESADVAVTERCVTGWRHHNIWSHVRACSDRQRVQQEVRTLQWQRGVWQGDVIIEYDVMSQVAVTGKCVTRWRDHSIWCHVTGCSDAYWGNGCTRKCGRCSDEVCDKVTGNCSICTVGWVPPRCDQGVCLFS